MLFKKQKIKDGHHTFEYLNSPDRVKGKPFDNIGQLDSANHFKQLEPALTGDEIVACFGSQGREIYFLRNSVKNQMRRLRQEANNNKTKLHWGQIATIVLGAVATILLGLGNDKWKKFAIIPTALVTAIASLVAVEDYYGLATSAGRAESDLAKLETEIERGILEAATQGSRPPFSIEGKQVVEWWLRADGIIKGVDEDWLSRFSKEAESKATPQR